MYKRVKISGFDTDIVPTSKVMLLMVKTENFSEKEELTKHIIDNNFKILNLCHIPEDGKLKTLSFSAKDRNRVSEILKYGERVDGSSLFSFIEPGKSDIYIMPRVEKFFVNSFASVPTLNVLCDYLDENGKPLDVAPANVLAKAERKLHESYRIVLRALAELEYYVIANHESEIPFPGMPDKNYHDSTPFTKFECLRNEALVTLAEAGIATKYGHSEVGRIFDKDNTLIEQHEIEFKAQSLRDMAENVSIAKWILRNLSAKHGVSVSFIPKISLEHAGTGMHIHLCAIKDGKNIIADSDGSLSSNALKMIGGVLEHAPSLAAFANSTPVSYLRFIACKESPMHICWASRNRLALIRIPLWWSFLKSENKDSCRETFEYRAPDALANIYLLLAGIALTVEYGLKKGEETLKVARELHFEIGHSEPKGLKILPRSCFEAAANLEKDRTFYETDDIFPKRLIDKTVEKLNAFNDKDLNKELASKPDDVLQSLMKEYMHYG